MTHFRIFLPVLYHIFRQKVKLDITYTKPFILLFHYLCYSVFNEINIVAKSHFPSAFLASSKMKTASVAPATTIQSQKSIGAM